MAGGARAQAPRPTWGQHWRHLCRSCCLQAWHRVRWRDHAVVWLPGFASDFDLLILLHVAATVAITHLCVTHDWHMDLSVSTLLVSPLVFPIAFSINESFRRQQAILLNVAQLQVRRPLPMRQSAPARWRETAHAAYGGSFHPTSS